MTHGDHWSAVYADTDRIIDEVIPRIVAEGTIGLKGTAPVAGEDGVVRSEEVIELRHGEGPLRFITYIATDSSGTDESRRFVTAFPFCWEGTARLLTIDEPRVAEGDLEAVVRARLGTGSGLLWFFDPHHFAHRERYRPGTEQDFVLAGLAYVLQPASTDAIEVTSGDMLRRHRERVLEDDPTVDPASITSVSISMERAAFMFPQSDQPENAQFMTTVERVDEFEVIGRRFSRIWATVMRPIDEEGDPLLLPIYASEETLGEYRPRIGDRIEGVMCVQGRRAEVV